VPVAQAFYPERSEGQPVGFPDSRENQTPEAEVAAEKVHLLSFQGAFFAEESLFLLDLHRREISRFARNDDIDRSEPGESCSVGITNLRLGWMNFGLEL
jgi:hypothetical protein